MRVWVLGVVAALVGCAAVTPAAPASPGPVGPPVLLAARATSGGFCRADAPCGETLTVKTDGSWSLERFDGRREGVLPAVRLALLVDAAERTGLLGAPAFTGTCPIAYDGQEVTYTWLEDGGVRKVGSCEREVDPADPLVAALDGLATQLS